MSTRTTTTSATYAATICMYRPSTSPTPTTSSSSSARAARLKTNLSNASAGTTITVTATPDNGYELAYITVDGERISGTSFKMPGHDVTVRVYFTNGAATLPFTDVNTGDWFFDYVAYVYANGLMDGTSATTFEPNGTMTRAMLVTILWRMEGEPVVNYLMPFTDVDGGAWYAEAVRWAASEGIVDRRKRHELRTQRRDNPRTVSGDTPPLRGRARHGGQPRRLRRRRERKRLRS